MAANEPGTPAPTKQELDAFRTYVAGKRLLIVDKSPSVRTSVAKALCLLGATASNLVLTPNFEEAIASIRSGRVEGIICDYHIGSRYGLELMSELREIRKEQDDTFCVLVTGNTDESAVAEAAEGDVDGYILKPFTLDLLTQYLLRAGLGKVRPSNYRAKIMDGTSLLQNGKPELAIEAFIEAKKLDPAPALACYYTGRAYQQTAALPQSETEYLEGLAHSPLHYRCSIALFDLRLGQSQHDSAYEVISKLAAAFPLSPQRLAKVVELAVRTQHYEDIVGYYAAFSRLDEKREELVKTVCAALVIGGKYQLRKGQHALGVELFQKASVSSAGNPLLLREIVMSLAAAGMVKEADPFLKRFPGESHGSVAYRVARFAIINASEELGIVIREGRDLISGGVHDPWVYGVLIARSSEAGLGPAVESLVEEALSRWPERAEEFKALAATPKSVRPR